MEKTISGHYGTTYSLAHNNRDIIPDNVDISRIHKNYFAVAAGKDLPDNLPQVKALQELWTDYRELSSLYWENYRIEREELQGRISRLRSQYYRQLWALNRPPSNLIEAILELLLLPLTLTADIILVAEYQKELNELETEKLQLWVEKNIFSSDQFALRDALLQHDRETGTKLAGYMERMLPLAEYTLQEYVQQPARAATLEEIYDKVFEPGFREFQAKQRKCRRYEGTYLEQIRERNRTVAKKKNRHESLRSQAEAIEIVFTIGDMDNTGYKKAPDDAAKSEALLRDFCDHLIADGQMCIVTEKNLQNPNWKPPFKHGLLILNLSGHFDEETPGIHLTVIPYTSGCKRGPFAQPSLGRALTGMGYPSTWKTKLDEQGNPVPKRDRNNNIVYNKDGSVRWQQETDGRGIIDWIEVQKDWIHAEMKRRYNWDREYKGSHPKGNCSTPEYKLRRAQERLLEVQNALQRTVQAHIIQMTAITQQFEKTMDQVLETSPDMQVILNYLRICDDQRFNELLNEAIEAADALTRKEKDEVKKGIMALIKNAENRKSQQSGATGQQSQIRTNSSQRER